MTTLAELRRANLREMKKSVPHPRPAEMAEVIIPPVEPAAPAALPLRVGKLQQRIAPRATQGPHPRPETAHNEDGSRRKPAFKRRRKPSSRLPHS